MYEPREPYQQQGECISNKRDVLATRGMHTQQHTLAQGYLLQGLLIDWQRNVHKPQAACLPRVGISAGLCQISF